MPTPYGSRGGMAFGAEELRVLRRALALALHPGPASPEDVQDCHRLAESLDEAMREGARLRAFLVADLARYRAALPGTAAGYLALLEEVLGTGYRPAPDDLAALGALRGNPTAAALLLRCQALTERDTPTRLTHRPPRQATQPDRAARQPHGAAEPDRVPQPPHWAAEPDRVVRQPHWAAEPDRVVRQSHRAVPRRQADQPPHLATQHLRRAVQSSGQDGRPVHGADKPPAGAARSAPQGAETLRQGVEPPRTAVRPAPVVPGSRARLLALPGGLSGGLFHGLSGGEPGGISGPVHDSRHGDLSDPADRPTPKPRKKPAEKPAAPAPSPKPAPAEPGPARRPIPTPGEVFPRRKPTPPPDDPPQQLAAG